MSQSMKEFVRSTLRKYALAEVKNSGNASSWWDHLPGKRKKKVVAVLGLSKGKDRALFARLSPGEQDEIRTYFTKHQGRVEDVEGEE